MFLLGKNKSVKRTFKLEDINKDPFSLPGLKDKYEILIIDDKNPPIIETLRDNGFRVQHLTDIENIEASEKYPIVACDISGIGRRLRPGSHNGGIHVLKEIKKYYPDKYLIQYSAMSQDIDGSLTKADKIYPKDTGIDAWQQDIEDSLRSLGNPKKRWLRIRRRLSEEGVDALDIYNIEQSYIKEILGVEESNLGNRAEESGLSPELKELVVKFASTTLAMGLKGLFEQ